MGQEDDAVWWDAGDGHQAFRKVHGVSGTAMATVQKQRLSHGKSPKYRREAKNGYLNFD